MQGCYSDAVHSDSDQLVSSNELSHSSRRVVCLQLKCDGFCKPRTLHLLYPKICQFQYLVLSRQCQSVGLVRCIATKFDETLMLSHFRAIKMCHFSTMVCDQIRRNCLRKPFESDSEQKFYTKSSQNVVSVRRFATILIKVSFQYDDSRPKQSIMRFQYDDLRPFLRDRHLFFFLVFHQKVEKCRFSTTNCDKNQINVVSVR